MLVIRVLRRQLRTDTPLTLSQRHCTLYKKASIAPSSRDNLPPSALMRVNVQHVDGAPPHSTNLGAPRNKALISPLTHNDASERHKTSGMNDGCSLAAASPHAKVHSSPLFNYHGGTALCASC